jgi:hypothetical protein
MEELLELRRSIEEGRYNDALFIVGELEEMAKSDKIHKIRSYITILLIHLIKQAAEARTTRSWQLSLDNAIEEIREVNARRTAGGEYMGAEELRHSVNEKFLPALKQAAVEAFGGVYTAKQLAAMIDAEAIKAQALDYILNGLPESED